MLLTGAHMLLACLSLQPHKNHIAYEDAFWVIMSTNIKAGLYIPSELLWQISCTIQPIKKAPFRLPALAWEVIQINKEELSSGEKS